MNSKNSEVEQPEGDHSISRISFTQYIDLGTKDNPNVENQLRVFYSTIKEIQLHSCGRVRNVDLLHPEVDPGRHDVLFWIGRAS